MNRGVAQDWEDKTYTIIHILSHTIIGTGMQDVHDVC